MRFYYLSPSLRSQFANRYIASYTLRSSPGPISQQKASRLRGPQPHPFEARRQFRKRPDNPSLHNPTRMQPVGTEIPVTAKVWKERGATAVGPQAHRKRSHNHSRLGRPRLQREHKRLHGEIAGTRTMRNASLRKAGIRAARAAD
jgi:hypothetical protein